MISQIIADFGNLERSLLECVAVTDYTVLRYEVTSTDGKMRLRAQLKTVRSLICSSISPGRARTIVRLKYSYHWQSADGLLVRRWDAVTITRICPTPRITSTCRWTGASVDPAPSINPFWMRFKRI